MAITIGNVYYADDPDKKIFRRVYPTIGELVRKLSAAGYTIEQIAAAVESAELEDPQWVTMGCDPSRKAILEKVPANNSDVNAPMIGLP
jgi:hypothetical protein